MYYVQPRKLRELVMVQYCENRRTEMLLSIGTMSLVYPLRLLYIVRIGWPVVLLISCAGEVATRWTAITYDSGCQDSVPIPNKCRLSFTGLKLDLNSRENRKNAIRRFARHTRRERSSS